MQFTRHLTNWLTLFALWFAIAAAFLALQQSTWWPLLFPLTGLAWTAGPLILTSFPTRGLVAGSIGTLITVATIYLFGLWLVVEMLGFFVPLLFDSATPPDSAEFALMLGWEGLKLMAGGAVGIVFGVGLRRRQEFLITSEMQI